LIRSDENGVASNRPDDWGAAHTCARDLTRSAVCVSPGQLERAFDVGEQVDKPPSQVLLVTLGALARKVPVQG
jgi:hypothetical protein